MTQKSISFDDAATAFVKGLGSRINFGLGLKDTLEM